MKTEAAEKAFDCVSWTRSTRDRISAEIRDMSQEELVRWFEDRRPTDPFLAELFDRREAPTGDRGSAPVAGGRRAALRS
ncbi:MAG: hypothetical protein OXG58_06245 [Gemmatimonadetes bacterium]|nr:hypothetical protein [Gemmatimonadota bacterium]MCY3943668.1 hypothetical protein [Gemmatimonadota bacterium]